MSESTDRPPRSFAVDPDGVATEMSMHERLEHMGISPAVSAAYDILTDDGMPPENAARLATAAERGGRDPEAFARHMRKLRSSWREMGGAR